MKSNKLYNKAAKVFALIPFTLCLLLLLAACSNDNLSDLQLAGNCAVESIELDGKYTGVVDPVSRTVKIKVPVSFLNKSAMKVTALNISEGAKANIAVGDVVDFSAAKVMHITRGDLYLDWTINVKNDEAKIKSFIINDTYKASINEEEHTITAFLPATVDIKKTSKDAFRLLTGLKDVDTNHNTKGVIDQTVADADKRYYIAGKDSAGNLIKPAGSTGIRYAMDIATTYDKTKNDDLDKDFKGYLKGGQNRQLNDLLDQAKALQAQVTGGDKQHFSTSLMVSSASSAAEEQVNAALARGMITPAQAGDYLTMIKRDLDNQVLGAGVGEHDIYVSGYPGDDGEDNESREYEKVSDAKQRDYYNNLIKHAVLDGTISYHMAASGDKFGTQIVITPKNPTKDDKTESNTVTDDNGEGPEVARSISIFIPDWNGQDAEQSLRRNTKTRAALEANNMETYDYDMDIPQEGTLRHTEAGFSLIGNDNEEVPVSKEDAQRLLNKRFIIEDVTEEAKNSFYDPSTGNSLVTDSQGNINQANYKRAYDNANKIIDIRTMQAMQDIYPETVSRIQEYTQNNMDATALQEEYDAERESIAAYIKNMINQD